MTPTPGQPMNHHCAGCHVTRPHPWVGDHWICYTCRRRVDVRADRCPRCGMEMVCGAAGTVCISCLYRDE